MAHSLLYHDTITQSSNCFLLIFFSCYIWKYYNLAFGPNIKRHSIHQSTCLITFILTQSGLHQYVMKPFVTFLHMYHQNFILKSFIIFTTVSINFISSFASQYPFELHQLKEFPKIEGVFKKVGLLFSLMNVTIEYEWLGSSIFWYYWYWNRTGSKLEFSMIVMITWLYISLPAPSAIGVHFSPSRSIG